MKKDLDMKISDDIEVVLEDETEEVFPAQMEESVDGDVRRLLFFRRGIPFVESLSLAVFLAMIFLVVVGFFPSSNFPSEFLKKAIFTGGTLLAFALWLVTRLEDGRFIFPGGLVFWSSLGIVGTTVLSSILAPSVASSIFGVGHEQDTLIAILVFFVAVFLSSTYFESVKRLVYLYASLLTALAIVAVTELIQLFSGGSFLGGGMINSVVGKWYDLGILFGLGIVTSLSCLELFSLSSRLKRLFTTVLVVSVLMTAIVNYDFVWLTVGIFSLILYIYRLAFSGALFRGLDRDSLDTPRIVDLYTFLKPSLVIVALSATLFFTSGTNGEVLKNRFNIFPFEVRPSWQSTVDLTRKAIDQNPWFGTGPNTFSLSWAALKPAGVNDTAFWGTDFNVGYGRVVSNGVTLGLVGLVSWLLFVFSLLYLAFRAVFFRFENNSSRAVVLTSALASLYLWVFSVFYVTDTAVLVLTFVLSGVFMAVLAKEGVIRNYEFSFLSDPRLSFVSVLLVVVLLISSVSAGYLLFRKYSALYNYGQGLYAVNVSGNVTDAETNLIRAIQYDEQDLYYRTLSSIEVARLQSLFGSSDMPQDKLVEAVKTTLSQASGAARRSVDINKSNYLNWMALGRVGEVVVPLKAITDAYKLASDSYNTARSLNPNNPAIDLSLARLEVANNNLTKAKDYINSAIQKKSNYTEAYFLLSQIYVSQGNISEGVAKAEQAVLFSPNDAGVQFQLGFLKYLGKDYVGAVDTLKKVTSIQQNYSNAKYFLGLSYSKLGKVSEAIAEFVDIAKFNPDNKEVDDILNNLRSGRGALDGLGANAEPEKRSKLPVKER